MNTNLFVFVLSALTTVSAFAQPVEGTILGTVRTSGRACPNGTVSVALAPDARAISLIFNPDSKDRVTAEVSAGRSVRRVSEARGCNIRLPFQFPAGYAFEIGNIDYRGYTYVEAGARTRFRATARWSGRDRVRAPASIVERLVSVPAGEPAFDDNFTVSQKVAVANVNACAPSTVNLDLTLYLGASTNRQRSDTILSLESVDGALVPQGSEPLDPLVKVGIFWKRCTSVIGSGPTVPSTLAKSVRLGQ